MSTLVQDLRFAVRLLARSRGFAAAALAAIALATGANTAVFSLVYSVVLRPLPFPSPERLVSITQFYAAFKESAVTAPVYFDWLEGASRLASFAAYSIGPFTLSGGETPESVPVARVAHSFFDCLGVSPAAGRTFSAAEDRPDTAGVVVVSRAFWSERPHRDWLELDGRRYNVIGEMPASFDFPPGARLWVPLALDPVRERSGGPVELVRVVGRLREGQSGTGLTAALAAISARAQGFSAGGRPVVQPLRTWLSGKTSRVWFVLLGIVTLVLLVACANVAGLLIARGAARRGEIAIRLAIGAPPGRIVRQLLTETLVLAAAGSAIGLALGAILLRLFLPLIPETMLAGRPVQLDGPVFAATALASLLIALFSGVAPARHALRPPNRRPLGLRGVLVASEVALSLVLLAGAALMVRSFSALLAVDPGFRADHTLTLTIDLPAAAYREPARQFQFLGAALDSLSTLPGVRDAALASSLPFSGAAGGFGLVSAEGEAPWGSADALRHRVQPLFVSAGYFRAAGTPLVAGREFTAADLSVRDGGVVVNRAFALRFFGTGSAVGRRVKLGFVESPEPWRTVVGVVADARQESLEETAAPVLYRPYPQRGNLRSAGFLLHTAGDPQAVAGAARLALARLDGGVAVAGVQTMEARLERSMASQKLRSLASLLLALLALSMVVTGLYGVLSFLVAQRVAEFGIRVAVGAAPGDIFRLVLGRGAALALAGIAAGIPLFLAAAQSLRGLLFGVSPSDPWILASVSALMLALALAASVLPARRAVRLDPMRCLRKD